MSERRPPPVLAFKPEARRPLAVEVQRLDSSHPSAAFAHHAHRFHELLLWSDGGGTHRVGREQHELRPGDLHLVGAGTPHTLRLDEGSRGLVVLFEADALGCPDASVLAVLGDPLLRPFVDGAAVALEVDARCTLEGRILALGNELGAPQANRTAAVVALLRLLLIDVTRLLPITVAPPAQSVVGEALAVVEERFRDALSLTDVAAAVHRDPSRLTAAVRQATGRTVQQWIEERRMAEARRLLRGSDWTVAAVGADVGFPDPGYFARRFALRHGLSPGRWRTEEAGA